jgi:hypothetical protein
MRSLAIAAIIFLLCGCAWDYKDQCNVVYCKPELKGKTEAQVLDEFGEPLDKLTIGDEFFWIYEVPSFWKWGASGRLGVKFENGIVSTTKFMPAAVDEKMFSTYQDDKKSEVAI